jgi:hypothetical protein
VIARPARACAALLLVGTLAGCDIGALQFRTDDRLSFQQPASRAKVTTPLTVSWTMKGFDATGLDGSSDSTHGAFAVFVDRAPMPVGKDLKWLARNDTGCKRDARCPDAAYLASRGVYLTTEPSLTLDQLPPVSDGVGDEQHYVNVVLVDGSGSRIGESAWYRPFQSKRRSTS